MERPDSNYRLISKGNPQLNKIPPNLSTAGVALNRGEGPKIYNSNQQDKPSTGTNSRRPN
jgi:hypothetical protein